MRRLTALTLITFLGLSVALAQTGEPEYIGVTAAHDMSTGDYIPLERVTATPGHEMRLGGIAGGRTWYEFPGLKSPVRFLVGKPVEFVIRVANQETDPTSLVEIYSLEPQNGTRILPMQDASSMFSVTSTNDAKAHLIQITAHKLGVKFFAFSPLRALPPGEYAISATNSNVAYLFGIDP